MSTLGLILIVLLILVIFGGFAGRGTYGGSAYYGPGLGIVGLIIVVVLVLVLLGVIGV